MYLSGVWVQGYVLGLSLGECLAVCKVWSSFEGAGGGGASVGNTTLGEHGET